MKKRKLNEDLFIDVPEVEYELDTNIDLEGPQPGNDVGVSGLLLDLIGDIAKTINNYNQLQADLKDYPEIAEVIKDFADDENVKLGKVQSALKTISPNAEYIMNGAVEADQELDPGSPLDESLQEAYDPSTIKNYFEDIWDKYSELRDVLYAFENAVQGNKDLEIAANSFITDIEEAAGDFWTDYQYYTSPIQEVDDEI